MGENLVERFKLPLWRFCNSGTEATLEAARLMRANTGRDIIIKIEGTYHGHHDALMFSVAPDPRSDRARASTPSPLPQAEGIPDAFAKLVRVVPFNDLEEVKRALAEHEGNVAGMIVEPAMMNCGVIFPEPGYLQGIKDLMHAAGAYLAFDEVKTGTTLAYGGAAEVVRRHARHPLPGQGDRRRAALRGDRRHPGALPAGRGRRVRHGGDLQRQPAHDGGQPGRPHRGHDARRRTTTSTGSTRCCRTAARRRSRRPVCRRT